MSTSNTTHEKLLAGMETSLNNDNEQSVVERVKQAIKLFDPKSVPQSRVLEVKKRLNAIGRMLWRRRIYTSRTEINLTIIRLPTLYS